MKKTLYQTLKEIEEIPIQFEKNKVQFEKTLSQFKDLNGYEHIIKEDVTPDFDITLMQKEAIESYLPNQVLENAILEQESIEDRLNRAKERFLGDRVFLPYKRDVEHNKSVNELQSLLSSTEQLLTIGKYYPDNIVNSLAFFLVVPPALYFGIEALSVLTGPAEQIDTQRMFSNFSSKIGITTLFGLSFGYFVSKNRSKKLPIDEAQYIDSVIEILYR